MDVFDEFDFDTPTSDQTHAKAKTFKKVIDINISTQEEKFDEIATDVNGVTQKINEEAERLKYQDTSAPPPLLLSSPSLFTTATNETVAKTTTKPPILAGKGTNSSFLSDIVKKAKRRLDGEGFEDKEEKQNKHKDELQVEEEQTLDDLTQMISDSSQTQMISSGISRNIRLHFEDQPTQIIDTKIPTFDTDSKVYSQYEDRPSQFFQEKKSIPTTDSEVVIQDNQENELIPTLKDAKQRYIDNYEEHYMEEEKELDEEENLFEVSQNKPRLSNRVSENEALSRENENDDDLDPTQNNLFHTESEEEQGSKEKETLTNNDHVSATVRFDISSPTQPVLTQTQVIDTIQSKLTENWNEKQNREQRLLKLTEQKRNLRLLKEQKEREKDGKKKDLAQFSSKSNAKNKKDQDIEYNSADEDLPSDGFVDYEPVVEPVDTDAFFKSLGVDFKKREFSAKVVSKAKHQAKEEEENKAKLESEEKYKEVIPGHDEENEEDGEDDKKSLEMIMLESNSDDSEEEEISAIERFDVALRFSSRKLIPNKKKSAMKAGSVRFNIMELLKLSKEQERKKLESNSSKKMARDIDAITKEFQESDDILERHFKMERNIKAKEEKQKRERIQMKKRRGIHDSDDDGEDDDYLDNEEEEDVAVKDEEVPESDFSEDEDEGEEDKGEELSISQRTKRKVSELGSANFGSDLNEDEITYDQTDDASRKLFEVLKSSENILKNQESLLKRRRLHVIDDEEDEDDDEIIPQLSQMASFKPLKITPMSDSGQHSLTQTISQLFNEASQLPTKDKTSYDCAGDIFAQLREKAKVEVLHSEESFIHNDGILASFAENTQDPLNRESFKTKLNFRKNNDSAELNTSGQMDGLMTNDYKSQEEGPLKLELQTQELLGSMLDRPTQIDLTQIDMIKSTPTDFIQATKSLKVTQKPRTKTQRIKIQLLDEEEENDDTYPNENPSELAEEQGESEYDDEQQQRIQLAEIYKLQRQQEQLLQKQQHHERKKAGVDEMMEDQAEESEDEFAGLGGADGELDDLDVANSEDEAIYDDITKVDQSRSEYIAKHIESDLRKDEELNKALLTAIDNGGLANFDFKDPEKALQLLKRQNMLKKLAKINAIKDKYEAEMNYKKRTKVALMDDEDEFKNMLDVNASVLPDSSDDEAGTPLGTTPMAERCSRIGLRKKRVTYEDSDEEADLYLSEITESMTSLDRTNTTLRSFNKKYPSFIANENPKKLEQTKQREEEYDGLVELPSTRIHKLEKLPTLERDPNEVIITMTSKSFGTGRGASIMSLGRTSVAGISSLGAGKQKKNQYGLFTRVLQPDTSCKKEKKVKKIISAFRGFKRNDGFD